MLYPAPGPDNLLGCTGKSQVKGTFLQVVGVTLCAAVPLWIHMYMDFILKSLTVPLGWDRFVPTVGGIHHEFEFAQRSITPAVIASSQQVACKLFDSGITE